MKKKRFKKITAWLSGFIASCFVIPGILSICEDVNGDFKSYFPALADGESFYYAEFTEKVYAWPDGGDIVYAEIRAKATEKSTISVEYETYSVNAIESVDYVGSHNTEVFEFAIAGEETRKVAFKSLLTNETKELLALRDEATQYGSRDTGPRSEEDDGWYARHFKVKILDITVKTNSSTIHITPENDAYHPEYANSQYYCSVVLPYKNLEKVITNYDSSIRGGGDKNTAYYNAIYERVAGRRSDWISNGVKELDGKKTWRSWKANHFDGDGADLYDWEIERFINTGIAKAYGTVLVKSIDTSDFHSNSNIHFFWGNSYALADYYDSYGETKKNDYKPGMPGLCMYIRVNPDVSGGYRLNGTATNYLSQGINPTKKEDKLVNVSGGPKEMQSDKKQLNYVLGGPARYWVGSEGSLYNATFFRMYPYDNRIMCGIAVYNSNKEVDIEIIEPYSAILLVDDTAPYIVDECTEYDKEGNLRLYIRFSEAVYATRQKGFMVNVNDASYQAVYKAGNYSDTLVYEISASKLASNHQRIKSITYELPDKDIADLSWSLDRYGTGYNNYLENTDQTRTSRIIGDEIDLSIPRLGVDVNKSLSYQNSYDIILSANSTPQSKDFTKGTVYYKWDTHEEWAPDVAKDPASYDHTHVLTEEEKGSFQVTLANVEPGQYYLHALAVPNRGGANAEIHYTSFGPYYYDKTTIPASLAFGTHPTSPEKKSDLKTKYLALEVGEKATAGAALDTIDLVLDVETSTGTTTKTRRIVQNGDIVSEFASIVKKTSNVYTYMSNVNEDDDTIPLDTLITDFLGDGVFRVDATAHFVITDKAGNKTTTNELSLSYDERTTFSSEVEFPSGYEKQASFEGITYDVYRYTEAGSITFSINASDTTTRGYVAAGAQFSVVINGKEYKAAKNQSTISITLEAGLYNIVPVVYGGPSSVDLVSENMYFCLTQGLDDMTTNRAKTQDDLVLNNQTYQLNDVQYYYYHNGTSSVKTMNYGATINESTGKYEGGSTYPTFSDLDAAKTYVKYMERQDIYVVEVTDLIANALNFGSGSTTYVKAPGESTYAQPGQLWIRYKKSTWSLDNPTDAYSWAFYFYKDSGKVEDGINVSEFSSLLDGAINAVTNRITSNGSTVYLVEEGSVSPTTNAPYLRPSQMHAYPESVGQTMNNIPYVSELKYTGNKAIYKNNVTVYGNDYPLATNLSLSISSTTTLYYQYFENDPNWTKINAHDGDLLGNLLPSQGIYHIKEYDEKGVSTFDVYIDHENTIISIYLNDNADNPTDLPDTSGLSYFSAKKFTITSLTDTDDLAYVAVFTYPYKVLKWVYYASDFAGNKKKTLTDGNYYVQVGDRSGNVNTYVVITSQSEFVLEANENSAKTGVVVKVLNRDEKEIYSYEVYVNGELKYTTFKNETIYRDTGIYRIVVTDIYGNSLSKTVIHEAPTPTVTWYYYSDSDTPIKYDEEHITRMKLVEDDTNPRVIYVNSSARVRAVFENSTSTADVEYEITGITKGDDYVYYESGKMITFLNLKAWKLRVWYSTNPEVDRTYIFVADNIAPNFGGTYMGDSYLPRVEYDGDNVVATSSFDLIDWTKYPNAGNVITLDYLDYENQGNSSLSFDNGETISGTQITIRVTDATGVKSVSATRDGQAITNLKYDENTGTIMLTGYGEYVITAVDELNNVSTFAFKNINTGLASGFIDGGSDKVNEKVINYGHESLTIKTFAPGVETILIECGDNSFTYEINYDGRLLTYGRYFRFNRLDYSSSSTDPEVIPYADYVETVGYSINVNDVVKNKWYPVISTTKYVVEASFDNENNVYYRIRIVEDDIHVEALFSLSGNKLPSLFKVDLSKKVSTVTLYSGGHEVEIGTNYYIHISETLTIETLGTDEDITNVKYSFSPLGIVQEYVTIYDGETWSSFVGEEKGYYQIIVTNKYGNVKTYNIKKIDTFGFVIMIHVMDGSDVYYEDQRHIAYSNHSIQLIVLSDAVSFLVRDRSYGDDYEERGGIYSEGKTILTIEKEGIYDVVVVGDNGIREYFTFEILNDETFVYQESWITGYNKDALLASEYYTNTKCSVHPGEGVIYIDVSINGELHKLYDAINAQPEKELESLEEAIGRYGDGTYTVGFRNKYGDLVKKAVHYSATPSLTLDRKTTNDPNTFESYDLNTALTRGFYSNYVLRFSTSSKQYRFILNGENYSLDEPRTLEFSNMGGTGSFSYKIRFIDEYGNDISFDAILYREDIFMDLSKMKIVTVNKEQYTKDDIVVLFADNLTGTVTYEGGETKRYVSGTAFYADGRYTFTVTDIAGNHASYTINHKSANHYALTDPGNNDAAVITDDVVNHSRVIFNSYDDSYVKYVFKDGELMSDYGSNIFSSTGHWELLIEDAIGNQTYESFYVINNSLAKFTYTAPYEYEVTEVWKVENEDSRTLLPIKGSTITLDENGSYVVVVTSTKTTSSFNFTITIDDTPPTAVLVGTENGGVTARDIRLTGLKSGDVVKIYKNGVLVNVTTIGSTNTSPTITSSGKYRIEVTNIQGVTTTYEFTRKPIASASASVFIIITCVIAMAGLAFGLIYHTKLKTDE